MNTHKPRYREMNNSCFDACTFYVGSHELGYLEVEMKKKKMNSGELFKIELFQ